MGKAGNSVGERRSTSEATVTVERRDIWCNGLQRRQLTTPRLAPTPKLEVEIWRKLHKRTVPISVGELLSWVLI